MKIHEYSCSIHAACHRTDVDGETCVTHGSVWIGKSIQVSAELIAGASDSKWIKMMITDVMLSNVQKFCQLITDVNDSSGFFIRLSSLCHPFVNSFILKPRVASDRVMLTDAKLLQCFQLKQRDQRVKPRTPIAKVDASNVASHKPVYKWNWTHWTHAKRIQKSNNVKYCWKLFWILVKSLLPRPPVILAPRVVVAVRTAVALLAAQVVPK